MACSIKDAVAGTDIRIQAEDKSFNFILGNINVSEKLIKLRFLIQEVLKDDKYRQISSFGFTARNAPISSQQENFLSVARIAQEVHEELIVCIKPVYANDRSSKIIGGNEKLDRQYEVSGQPSQREDEKAYRLYSEEDIKSSEGLELKKRLYWNERISDFSKEIKSNKVSKFEAYGIIDVEWTQKQTDLLRVMADEAILILQEKNVDPMSRKCTNEEADIEKAYERLDQADFKLKTCYERIEQLHKKDDSNKVKFIKEEEENFDKLYSDLKAQQANLKKCLNVYEEREKCCSENDTTESCRGSIPEGELQTLIEGVKHDYTIDDLYLMEEENMELE